MKLSNEWHDYECISAGNGEKLERWGNVILRRPDPQAMWLVAYNDMWKNPDAFYHRSDKGGGYWDFKKKLPDYWTIKFKIYESSFYYRYYRPRWFIFGGVSSRKGL